MFTFKHLLLIVAVLFTQCISAAQPSVLLAKVYDETKHYDVSKYLVSEKYVKKFQVDSPSLSRSDALKFVAKDSQSKKIYICIFEFCLW